MSIYEVIVYIVIAIGMFLGFTITIIALRMWYNLKQDDKLKTQLSEVKTMSTGNKIAISKLGGKFKEFKEGEYETEEQEQPALDLGSMPDLSSLTLEQAAEFIGIDPKTLKNPIIRPTAEKIFEQLKAKQKQGKPATDFEDINTGY